MNNNQTIAEDLDPINQYRQQVDSKAIIDDPEQRLVVEKLSILSRRLNSSNLSKTGFARAIFGWGREKIVLSSIEGLYIYGSVGRGKSMLMQFFADSLIASQIWRVHFIDFMAEIHKRLNLLRGEGVADPLERLAENIANEYRVLCLDEMQVENIADAMIVGRLFESLFKHHVVLVTTSNRHPKDLYKGGLNRHRFEPFILEISKACEVICLDGPKDYRQSHDQDLRYFSPLDDSTQSKFVNLWAQEGMQKSKSIWIGTREWELKKVADNSVWLDFEEACMQPRGASDYQAITNNFKCVYLDNIPYFNAHNTSSVSRFIAMIDVFYEEKMKIYLRSIAPFDCIHSDLNTKFVFERTRSRLHEMSGEKWNAD